MHYKSTAFIAPMILILNTCNVNAQTRYATGCEHGSVNMNCWSGNPNAERIDWWTSDPGGNTVDHILRLTSAGHEYPTDGYKDRLTTSLSDGILTVNPLNASDQSFYRCFHRNVGEPVDASGNTYNLTVVEAPKYVKIGGQEDGGDTGVSAGTRVNCTSSGPLIDRMVFNDEEGHQCIGSDDAFDCISEKEVQIDNTTSLLCKVYISEECSYSASVTFRVGPSIDPTGTEPDPTSDTNGTTASQSISQIAMMLFLVITKLLLVD